MKEMQKQKVRRTLKRKVKNSNLFIDLREKEYYTKPSEKKRHKRNLAKLGLRLGIGTKKTFGPFIVKPMFAMNLGLGEEGSGFSTLTLNVGLGSQPILTIK